MTTSNHPLPRLFDIPSSISDSRSSNYSPHSVDWDKITDSDRSKYCDHIRDHLPVISEELVPCRDPKCMLHLNSIDSVCIQLTECIPDGARRYLLKVRPKRRGWKNCACHLQQSAKFWHQVWQNCGCPVLFQIKKNSKKRYKYEVRRLRRQQQHIKSELIGEALSKSSTRDFWKEVRKMTQSMKGRRPLLLL